MHPPGCFCTFQTSRWVDTGAQPLTSDDGKIILAVNGEIYNHISLRKSFGPDIKFKTHSDCEVIIPLVSAWCPQCARTFVLIVILQYNQQDKNLCGMLDGMFSFVLLDESRTPSRIVAARDPVGITTLYQGWSSKRPGAVFFASELKALVDDCDKIISFPPGHVYDSLDNSTIRYFQPSWFNTDEDPRPTNRTDLNLLRTSLEAAVRKRLMSEVPYGVLLSGGLDSSLIASIAARETEKVAQAQFDARQRRIQEVINGPSSPNIQFIGEQGK